MAGLALTPSSTSAANIVTEIIEGLGKNETVKQNYRRLIQYLEMSDLEIIAQFPTSSTSKKTHSKFRLCFLVTKYINLRWNSARLHLVRTNELGLLVLNSAGRGGPLL